MQEQPGLLLVRLGDRFCISGSLSLGDLLDQLGTRAEGPERQSEGRRETVVHILDGPVNVVEQGGPVPLVYGIIRTGSTVVAGGIQVEQLSV